MMTDEQIIQLMQDLHSWEDKYRFIIQQGKMLSKIDPENKSQAIEIKGCENQVFINIENKEKKYYFQADTEARIINGLIYIIFAAINGKEKEEILKFDFSHYFTKLDLLQHLSPSRNNGIHAIIHSIKDLIEKK